ncbi:hypothetical protein F3Y22_tig00111392pilonHSYRG00436 [Hibiscus syriacus]|uniref:Uncharacterized protein n=1 Tax=Hibiscus syriacus TaxID=106335 RepID=A0A6A2YKA5_HIBSY|nr:2S sulfur-rich seed storage protein 2-like [Hibiscus syriacus]KAE8680199.1 hypothetical protein F3Y22_tig00111392pilonHSYRG00436 [Hibiscus syriacus]
MAKLAVYLATFVLVLFIAHASITTVTVNEDGSTWRPSRQSQSRCQEQIREQDHLQDCQKYMEEQCGGGRSRLNRQCSGYLDSCCWQLEKMDNQCRCPGLKHAAMQQMKGQMETEEMQELYEAAEKIMSKCDKEPRRCDFHLATGSEGPNPQLNC